MILTLGQLSDGHTLGHDDAKRVVLSVGCFDVLHPGHLEHLKQARAMGDLLVVGVTGDRYVHKGPGRPVFNEGNRAQLLAALKLVDYVTVVDSGSAVGIIEALKPAVYAKGPDYARGEDDAGNLEAERRAVESGGGRLAFTQGQEMHSKEIIGRMLAGGLSEITPEGVTHVSSLRNQGYSAEMVIDYLDRAKKLFCGVMGEAIIDEYQYVRPLGKSAKDNLVEYEFEDGRDAFRSFDGGAKVVRAHLNESTKLVTPNFVSGEPVVKRRFIERAFNQKVFGCVPGAVTITPFAIDRLDKWDLSRLVVADFGHGFITPNIAQEVSDRVMYLALTVQSNAANWGFNLLTKWPRATYVVVDEMELRLACGDRYGPLQRMVATSQALRMGTAMFAVTLGHKGCLIYDGHSFHRCPALMNKVVDRMGAGDAFLAWSAPLVYQSAPMEIVALVGNVAGGLEAGMVGNIPITQAMVRQTVRELFND